MARTAISSFGLERFPAGRSAPIDDPRERERRRAECVTVKYVTSRPVDRCYDVGHNLRMSDTVMGNSARSGDG